MSQRVTNQRPLFRYTACHVHKSVDYQFVINEHLNGKEGEFPTHQFWKNYRELKKESRVIFDKPGN